MSDTHARSPLLGWAFLLSSALAVAGTVWSQLGATAATTLNGGQSRGALYTGFVLAVLALSAGVAIPLTPRITSRFGTRTTFVVAELLAAAVWAVVGVFVLIVDDPLGPLLIGMLFAGTFGGVAAVLTPGLTHAYLGGTSLAHAYSVRSVATGFGAVVGALSAAAVISATQPGWGLIGNAVLSVPLGVFVLSRPPGAGFPEVEQDGRGWRALWRDLARNRSLRRAAGLSAAVVIFVVPMVSMIVPIAQSLRQSPLIPGAGIVLAGVALGRLATPTIVTRLRNGRDDLMASLRAITATAIFMLALAISSMLLTGRVELVVWAVIAMGIGATRFASRSLTLGAADSSLGDGRGLEGISAAVMIAALAAPIGTVTWGIALSVMPPWAVLAVSAGGMLTVALILRVRHPSSAGRD